MGRWCGCAVKAGWELELSDHILLSPPALPRLLWRAWSTRSKRPGPVAALPVVRWSMPQVRVQAQAIEQYRDVCGFDAGQGVPLTYPQLLTFPLVMAYLCSSDCPWPAVGTVHLANVIEQRAALQAGDVVSVELVTGALRAHEKGQVFDLGLFIRRDGDVVWRGTQSLLRRGVRHPAGALYDSGFDHEAALVRTFDFEAPAHIGRRYAWVSGDFNPMHLSVLSARLLGFRRTIAHGLWTQARALAGLLPAQPLTHATLTTEFKSPVLLPSRLAVWQQRQEDSTRFEVRDVHADRYHLRALLTV